MRFAFPERSTDVPLLSSVSEDAKDSKKKDGEINSPLQKTGVRSDFEDDREDQGALGGVFVYVPF